MDPRDQFFKNLNVLKYNWCKIKCINLSTVWWILVYVWNLWTYPSSPKFPLKSQANIFLRRGCNAFTRFSQKGEEWKLQLKPGSLRIHSFIQHIVKIRTQLTKMATIWELNVPGITTGTLHVLSLTLTKILKCTYHHPMYHLHFADKETKAQNEVTCSMPLNYVGICKS